MDMVDADDRLSPQFHDLLGKIQLQATPGHRIALHVLHAGDRLRMHGDAWDGLTAGDGIEEGRIRSSWANSYGWATWEARLGPAAEARTLLWTGRVSRFRQGYRDDFGSIGTPEQMAVRDERSVVLTGAREEAEWELSPDLLLRFGGEAVRTAADYDYYADTKTPYVTADGLVRLRADTLRVSLEPEGTRIGLFLAARGRVRDRLTTEVGVRFDRISQTGESHLSPRFLTSLELGGGLTLHASAGRYHQSQGIGELQVGDGQTLYAPAERSELFALGLQRRFGPGLSVRLEGYHRRISDQQPRWVGLEQELAIFPEQEGDRLRLDPGRARVRGMEAFAEGSLGTAWSWSASYALAAAEEEIPQEGSCPEGPTCLADPWVPRARDQRHAVNLRMEYRPSSRWELAAGWTFHSGWPTTEWKYGVVPLANGSWFWTRTFGPLNAARLPDYHRLDLRVTRAFQFRGGALDVYADLFNVYDRRNLGSIRFGGRLEQDGQVTTVRRDGGEEMLPFLPIFGLRYRF
jgi:outer membrane receptor protein involved in Fe transport